MTEQICKATKALYLVLLRNATVTAIETLLNRATPSTLPFQEPRTISDGGQVAFTEQVRGLLILAHEIETRVASIEADDDMDAADGQA